MKSTRFSLLTMSRAYDILKKRVHASPFSALRTQEAIELLYTSTLAPEMMIYPFFWRSDIWVGDLHPLFNFNELFTGDDGLISSRDTDRQKMKLFAEQLAIDLKPALDDIAEKAQDSLED